MKLPNNITYEKIEQEVIQANSDENHYPTKVYTEVQ